MSTNYTIYCENCTIRIASILKKLLKAEPLTPIYDEPDVWNEVAGIREDDGKMYQCKRS